MPRYGTIPGVEESRAGGKEGAGEDGLASGYRAFAMTEDSAPSGSPGFARRTMSEAKSLRDSGVQADPCQQIPHPWLRLSAD